MLALLARHGDVHPLLAVLLPVAIAATVVVHAGGGPTRDETAQLLDRDLDLAERVATALEVERTTETAGRSPLERSLIADAGDRLTGAGARVRAHAGSATRIGLALGLALLAAALLVPLGDSAATSAGGTRAGAAAGGSASSAAGGTTAGGARPAPRIVNGTSTAPPKRMTPYSRRSVAPVPPGLGAEAARARAGAQERAALRGGRSAPSAASTRPPPAPSTDRGAQTSGGNRGVSPVSRPTGTHRTGTPGATDGPRGKAGEGASALGAKEGDKRTGAEGGAGTASQSGKNAGNTSAGGVPTTRNGGVPTVPKPGGGTPGEASNQPGIAGAGGAAGNSNGQQRLGAPGAVLRTPGVLPLAAGFRAGTSTAKGKRGQGTGAGDGRGRGRAESGAGGVAAAGGADAGAVAFAFPDVRSAPGLRGPLLLQYFGR